MNILFIFKLFVNPIYFVFNYKNLFTIKNKIYMVHITIKHKFLTLIKLGISLTPKN